MEWVLPIIIDYGSQIGELGYSAYWCVVAVSFTSFSTDYQEFDFTSVNF